MKTMSFFIKKRSIITLLALFAFSINAHAQLKVALYPYLPRGDQFQQVLTDEWNKLGTGISLQFVNYDCYSADPPDDLHVFVFDGVYLNYFQAQGYLNTIDTTKIDDYNRFWPFTRQAVITNNSVYGVPYLSCANVYFYRKSDPGLNTGSDLSLSDFYKVIGPATYTDTIPPYGTGLLMDYSGSTTDACYYVAGWMNFYNTYTTSPPLPSYNQLDPRVVQNLWTYTRMAGIAQASYSDPGTNRINWFSQGRGRSMIGITENSASLPNSYLDNIDFRLMPLSDNTSSTRNFFVDMAGINSKTPVQLQQYAQALINLMTSDAVMYNSMIPTQQNPNPQFLIPVSINVMNTLISVHPLYNSISNLLQNHQPYQFLLSRGSRPWLYSNKSGIRKILLQPSMTSQPNKGVNQRQKIKSKRKMEMAR